MLIPIIIAMCFLPADISIKIGTLDFQAIRILALVGFLRTYFDAQFQKIKLNTIDKLVLLFSIFGAIMYVIASENTFDAFTYKSGVVIDTVLLYILLRHIIQSKEDLQLSVKIIGICVIVLLPFTASEYFTGNNLFSIVGRDAISIRGGEVRAAGTFSHAILYGSFAAAVIPVLWADYKVQKSTVRLFSILSCLFIVYACQSSGPIVALAGAVFFLFFFRWKQHSAALVKLMLAAAIVIHLVRESPIWHFLYVRIAIKASSTGYHRYLLSEAAVKEFWDWWLIGYGDLGPQWHLKYWPWTHASFTDITNHYLLEGVRGGFFTMLVFIILCVKSVKVLGSYAILQSDQRDQWLWWGFTVMMITHCISFLSVAYFGQITMLLYMTLAVAAYTLDVSSPQPGTKRMKSKII